MPPLDHWNYRAALALALFLPSNIEDEVTFADILTHHGALRILTLLTDNEVFATEYIFAFIFLRTGIKPHLATKLTTLNQVLNLGQINFSSHFPILKEEDMDESPDSWVAVAIPLLDNVTESGDEE